MPHYSLPGLWLYIGHGDASGDPSGVSVTHLDSQIGHRDSSASGVTVTQVNSQIGHSDSSGQSQWRHRDASETAEAPIYARAELPTELPIVEVVDSSDTTTTSDGSSGAVLTAEFEAALIQTVLPRRGEKYLPGEHGGQDHRLNPMRRLIRRYAWERQVTVHPSHAARLGDFIASADWITQRWGHVGAAKDLLEMWVETGEDLSRSWEPPPESEEIAPVKYRDLLENRADPEAQRIWNDALGQLQLHVTRPNFETWLKHTIGIGMSDGHFVVGAPNAFIAEMLEQRMYSLISRTLESVVRQEIDVRFEVYLNTDEQVQLRTLS